MDARQFDSIVKGMAQTRISRLAAVRVLAGVLAGVLAAGWLACDGEAKRHGARKAKKRRRRKNKQQRHDRNTRKQEFARIGESCRNGEPCGTYTECRLDVCFPTKCRIGARVVDAQTRNPDDPCQICNPQVFGDGWKRWDDLPDGTTCPPDTDGNPCLSTFIATCQRGKCVAEPVANGSACGDNLVCCSGSCCGQWECCSEDGACQSCGLECQIGDVSYPAGAEETPGGCRYCDPNRSESEWSLRDDGDTCGSTSGRECCNGVCCAPGECCVGLTCQACACDNAGGRRRNRRTAAADACDPACEIDGQPYAEGDPNPDNPCEVCDSAQNPAAWSPAPFLTKCGANLDQICCDGVCCPDGECCRPGFQSCSVEWCGIVDPCPYVAEPCGCTIDGQFYAQQEINPANSCQWCDAYWSTTGWSSRPSYIRCGPFADRFCCDGVCCETGSCCNANETCEAGAPGCVGCTINGRYYGDNAPNPDDPCQRCRVELSTTSWSPGANGTVCEAVIVEGVYWGDRICCEGVCCELYDCCGVSGACHTPAEGPCQ